ncbi:anthranilate synthase component I [Acidothermaceae bacterium B102]|nr:anthranilate synthase component I [Acidothermaceae bacterium B102]
MSATARSEEVTFSSAGGVLVRRWWQTVDSVAHTDELLAALDTHRGMLESSNYEFPGRYTQRLRGFVDPPLAVVSRDRMVRVEALNERGQVLLPAVRRTLEMLPAVERLIDSGDALEVHVRLPAERFPEEARSKQDTVFSVIRALLELFRIDRAQDDQLGLYGAFGYDLVFQFENIDRQVERDLTQRDMVLYLPDRLFVSSHDEPTGRLISYEFEVDGVSTERLPRTGRAIPYVAATAVERTRDNEPGGFAETVRKAKESFKAGDLFEVVCGQTFFTPCTYAPSVVFNRLRERNPAPYGVLVNLGDAEYLVSASPEMYVRVQGSRVETCPISGTIVRGRDVFEDEVNIRELLNSEKDTSELTMCTDVDRNDKSRICVPGSVKVIGRRQIELYSRLIHTVDHVEGTLREGFDAIDAFLSHMWAVTVTGAPKLWAMRFIESRERSPRRWYGGAFGRLGFDGDADTGLTLRTVHVAHGVAETRAGGTLLIDSDADAEEAETEIKASAFLDALTKPVADVPQAATVYAESSSPKPRLLLVDHEDSFVHTLANYFRQAGAEVQTVRAPLKRDELEAAIAAFQPQMLVLSPGPGRPSDFAVGTSIEVALENDLAVFGVCLGLQGMVEHFGGSLGLLDYPMHGKASAIKRVNSGHRSMLFDGLPTQFRAGRYHSIFALTLPDELVCSAVTDDGVVMAVEHTSLPVSAVQFHPESIMSADGEVGLRLVRNVVESLVASAAAAS